MVLIPVRCLYCQSDQVTKRGKTKTAKQRYRCHNPDCAHQSFLLDPAYKGRLPAVNKPLLRILEPNAVEVVMCRVEDAEVD